MFRAWLDHDSNAHAAASHDTHVAVENARSKVAHLASVSPSEVVFVSGATEANNLAIQGLKNHLHAVGRRRVIVCAAEHASVLAAAEGLGNSFEVVRAPIERDGVIDLNALAAAATSATGIISVAAANHEIGTVQPIADIARMAAKCGAFFHSDLAQAAGKIPLELDGVHLASISAHKLYGPLGIGALLVRRPVRRLMQPLIRGGGQEGGLRSGTLAAPLCIAFGTACELAAAELSHQAAQLGKLRGRLLVGLQRRIEGMSVNGGLDNRLPGNLNIGFDGVDAEALVMRVRDSLAIATGSACDAHSLEPSHVLLALGLSREQAESSIRIGLGHSTTEEDIDRAIELVAAAVYELRAVRYRASA
jgi:cysteine desulfurase